MKDRVEWNITEIARTFRCCRDTARKKIKEAGVAPCGKRGVVPVYDPVEVGRALFSREGGL
ncbi:hypothetical protein [Vibrio splendidus]|uniref:Helix-turn-helix domain-containing protein n=1 Tax=Vibrio splendidus TaxID=29497 RepID=A0A2T5DXF6_VIBSP|nr:hypothetical protein [Vibrio splendidus]OEE73418.1 hypothetical protein A147_00965 [Vibrio splendidus FF-6]PTP11774.1 hypothetical protein CWO36_24140 [Vibrio splendidus]